MTLYAWGANCFGQLGLGHKSEQEISPQKVNLRGSDLSAEDIVSISAGVAHSLILDTKGRVFSCGSNCSGRLGLLDDTFKFTQIEILEKFKIVQISCGSDFNAAVSECGKQFVWGSNSSNQLGISSNITSTAIPTKLQVPRKLAAGLKNVSCGWGHSVIISKEGCLLVSGDGTEGQLGLGENSNDNNNIIMRKVPHIGNIISVATGHHHTLALKDDGAVLSWGENQHGELGFDRDDLPRSYVPVETFFSEGLRSVCAGWQHSAALTVAGEILTWGRSTSGQLGAEREVMHEPEKVPTLSNVEQLSCGVAHNLALTRDNKLYSWGWNELGSCGTGDIKDVLFPVQILKKRKVRYCVASYGSSFAVIE
ncbi:unnamed protein product [Ceutorhynchus assimilis]|uniref:RCC1-like domain-containing protein n=1 Tax=Ceutorhynchus assimilis TaxID=467358 RepID=A0A9N9MBS9_9CUCU|nr:unnamed protein product [Ceutorhynchus assimilis]